MEKVSRPAWPLPHTIASSSKQPWRQRGAEVAFWTSTLPWSRSGKVYRQPEKIGSVGATDPELEEEGEEEVVVVLGMEMEVGMVKVCGG